MKNAENFREFLWNLHIQCIKQGENNPEQVVCELKKPKNAM